MYKVEGYDKDNDVFIKYWSGSNLEMAKEIALTLYKIAEKDELIRYTNDGDKEPIDLIFVFNDNGEVVYALNDMRQRIRNILDDLYTESEILPENFGEEIVNELVVRFVHDRYEITKENVIEEIFCCYTCKMQ